MDDPFWTITIRIPKPSRRWLQCSLRTFLLMVLIAGVVAGIMGSIVRQRLEAGKYYPRAYDVSDLLAQSANARTSLPNWEPLIREIKATVAPRTWNDVGGLATIEYFPTNQTLIVRQKEDVHKTITDVLVAKRRMAATDRQ